MRALEIETETDDGLAIGPLAGAQRISGRDEQRSAVIADAAGRPDPATDTAGAPGGDRLGIVEIDADDPAAVLSAIAEMTAIGDVELVLGDQQGAALTLNPRREGEAARPQSLGNIDGKAGQDRAVAD